MYLLPKLRTEPKKVVIDAASYLVDIWYLDTWRIQRKEQISSRLQYNKL